MDDAGVILRSRCMLGSSVRLNDTLNKFHKDGVRGTLSRPIGVWWLENGPTIDLVLVKL